MEENAQLRAEKMITATNATTVFRTTNIEGIGNKKTNFAIFLIFIIFIFILKKL